MQIPALTGQSARPYQSIERQTITGCDGLPLADASIVQPILVPTLARKAQGSLDDLSITEIVEIYHRAAVIFAQGEPGGLALTAYIEVVCRSTGLPISVVQRGAAEFFPAALSQIEALLEAQLGGELSVLDTRLRRRRGVSVGYVPRGRNLAVVMPGNHPSTHVLWLIALALKVPALVRPSYEDVFTPYRLAAALLQPGLPPAALSVLPGQHDLVRPMTTYCDLSILFGGQAIANLYGGRRDTLVYGPGRSKAIVLADTPLDEAADVLYRLMVDQGGRGCINCSSILVEGGRTDALARALAERLDATPTLNPLAADARLPSAHDYHESTQLDAYIDERAAGAREWTRRGAAQKVDNVTVLRPRLFEVESAEHPLFGVEMAFPFAVMTSVGRRDQLVQAARDSLAVVVIGRDEALLNRLLLEPTIDKIYGHGSRSTEFDPLEPHEGYLVDFLFEHKAFR